MGHTEWSHDRASDEQLVGGRSSGLCGWVHSASCSRSPFSSIADRTSCRVRDWLQDFLLRPFAVEGKGATLVVWWKGTGQTGRSPISIRRQIQERSVCARFLVSPVSEHQQLLYFLFQLPKQLSQKLLLWFLLGQGQRLLKRGPSLGGPAEPAVHICTGGMSQVVICQFAMFQHRLDLRQTGLWTFAHGNSHGTIELYNRRRLNSYQLVVKRNNLPPVGCSGRFRLRMNGRDRSLQCVGAEAAGIQGFLQQRHSL